MKKEYPKKHPKETGKILAVAYSAAAAFTAISILVPVLWQRLHRK
ncbi:MAG TPA: hypothetical protein VKR06_35940 [Ktedonosporobacter sp.]|nr:hypothetical protein [Ktedonosporobacter sp.]